ncbi:MAG: C4-dicarboxylate transporter DctA [Pseudolabrys sp.]
MATATSALETAKKPFYRILYIQVLIAIVIGGFLGWLYPAVASSPWIGALGTGFVKLVKMVVTPIIFCTVVSGIAHIKDSRQVGRIGFKTLVYFEVVSTVALIIGLVVGNVVQPGAGFSGTVPDATLVANFVKQAEHQSAVGFVLNIIPDSVVGAFVKNDVLQVILFSILFGFGLQLAGERGRLARDFVDSAARAIYGIIAIVMKAAPVASFGAMAFTIGKFGPQVISNLFGMLMTFYLSVAFFVFVVLGIIAYWAGFSIFKFVTYIKDELLITLGTGSSESVLPQLMDKLENLGCSKSVVGLVVPAGYSFNNDGGNIYQTLATVFVAQFMGFDLTWTQQLGIVLVAMLTSKGTAGVAGAGFITLAATLSVFDPKLVPGMAVLLGIDKFMSECRAVTNIVGNGVAAVVVARWEGEMDDKKLNAKLNQMPPVELGASFEPNRS